MDHNIALSDLPSCLAGLVGTKLPGGMHLLCLCPVHGHSIADACFLFTLPRTPFHQLRGFYHTFDATSFYWLSMAIKERSHPY